jgi:hypothetical protein
MKACVTGLLRIPNGELIGPDAGHDKLAGRVRLRRQLDAGELRGAPGGQLPLLFLFLFGADQRLERRFRGGGLFVELVHFGLHRCALRVGRREQDAALLRERVERELLLLRLRLFALELRLRAEQTIPDRDDVRFVGPALADRRFVRFDQVANVVPALDEVAERTRAEQHVDVTEVAVLVGVDDAAVERVLMARQRALRRGELELVPCHLALRGFDAALDGADLAVDGGDVVVGLREF